MRFQGAVIKEQGVTFAIVIVKPHVVQSSTESATMMQAFRPYFGTIPIVLMAQDYRSVPTYRGRRDLVDFMVHVPLSAVSWKEYLVA